MNQYVVYKPVTERVPDGQYQDLLRRIRDDGEWYPNQMDEPAKTIFGAQLEYEITNGAPMITVRDTVTRNKYGRSPTSQAIAEMIAFMNGARTQEELESFGCFWWKNWVTPEKCLKRGLKPGDLGPGSYGAAWAQFPTNDGPFNQITALVAQIRDNPQLRTHFLTPWIPQYIYRAEGYKQKVVVVPCHGWVNVRINVDTGKMVIIHRQRSADVPVGFPANMVGYAAFGLMLAKVTGYTFDRIIYAIDDAHIYKRQIEAVDELINQPYQTLPTITLNRDVALITDFRESDFTIDDYLPTGKRAILSTPI